jgi:hypothetical protein
MNPTERKGQEGVIPHQDRQHQPKAHMANPIPTTNPTERKGREGVIPHQDRQHQPMAHMANPYKETCARNHQAQHNKDTKLTSFRSSPPRLTTVVLQTQQGSTVVVNHLRLTTKYDDDDGEDGRGRGRGRGREVKRTRDEDER